MKKIAQQRLHLAFLCVVLLFLALSGRAAQAAAPNFGASAKSVNKAVTFLGDTVVYTVRLDNTLGTTDALDVVFSDHLPRGIEVQLFSLDGVPQALTLLSDGLSVGTIAAGTSRTVSITGLVTAIPTRPDAAQYDNSASWNYRYRPTPGAAKINANFVSNTATTQIVRLEPSMAIATVNLGVVLGTNLGNEITYTLTVANTGNLNSAGTTLTNLIPVGATYVAGSTKLNGVALGDIGVAGPYVLGGQINSPGRAAGQINAGETATIVFKVRSLILPVINATVVDADGLGPIPPLNVRGSTQSLGADLSLSKTDGQTSAVAGSNLTYTLAVKNLGGTTLSSVQVVDNLPATLQNPVWTASAGTYNPASGQWTGLSLAAGQTVSLTLAVRLSPSATGTLSNTASVSPPEGVLDLNGLNNAATDSDSILVQADLGVTQSDGTAAVVAGTPLSYEITVTNAGPSALSSLTLSDSVPAALQNPTFSPDEGTYDAASGVWSGLNLSPGASAQITLNGVVAASATGSFTNTVSVAVPSGASDPVAANNSASDTNSIAPPSLVLIQSVDKATAKAGEILTYTLSYRNGGASGVRGVGIRTQIPGFTTFVAAAYAALPVGLTACSVTSPSVGATGQIAWDFSGTLAPGAVGTVSFQVKVE